MKVGKIFTYTLVVSALANRKVQRDTRKSCLSSIHLVQYPNPYWKISPWISNKQKEIVCKEAYDKSMAENKIDEAGIPDDGNACGNHKISQVFHLQDAEQARPEGKVKVYKVPADMGSLYLRAAATYRRYL